MASVLDKILKNSKIKETAVLTESKVFGKKEAISTSIPMLNVALSGELTGGMFPGILTVAGESRHFKTLFSLVIAKAFQDKHSDGIVIFYDSEFGSPPEYFASVGLDMDRIVHIPIKNIEELKFDIVNQLEGFDRKDNVLIIIDSVGNLASIKEATDALKENSAQDMSRPKQMKSLFRIITPYLNLKNIPLIAIAHTYKEQTLFPKDIISGGQGILLSSDNAWIITRRKDLESQKQKKTVGYEFVINVEKSRYVQEKSKIPITVTFGGGIKRYSGLFDIALEGGFLRKPKNGWYEPFDPVTGELLADKMFTEQHLLDNKDDIWNTLIEKTNFPDYVRTTFKFEGSPLLDDNDQHEHEEDENDETV